MNKKRDISRFKLFCINSAFIIGASTLMGYTMSEGNFYKGIVWGMMSSATLFLLSAKPLLSKFKDHSRPKQSESRRDRYDEKSAERKIGKNRNKLKI